MPGCSKISLCHFLCWQQKHDVYCCAIWSRDAVLSKDRTHDLMDVLNRQDNYSMQLCYVKQHIYIATAQNMWQGFKYKLQTHQQIWDTKALELCGVFWSEVDLTTSFALPSQPVINHNNKTVFWSHTTLVEVWSSFGTKTTHVQVWLFTDSSNHRGHLPPRTLRLCDDVTQLPPFLFTGKVNRLLCDLSTNMCCFFDICWNDWCCHFSWESSFWTHSEASAYHQRLCCDVIKWQSLASLHRLMAGTVGAFRRWIAGTFPRLTICVCMCVEKSVFCLFMHTTRQTN